MILVNKVVLNPKVTSGKKDQIVYFGYTVSPSNATNKEIQVSSSNPAIIEIAQNSFRFKKPGAVVITVESLDGGFKETFSANCSLENNYIETVKEMELRLQQYYDVLIKEFNVTKNESIAEISETKIKLLNEVERITTNLLDSVKRVTENNITYLDERVIENVKQLNDLATKHLVEIESTSAKEMDYIDYKLREMTSYVDRVFESIKTFINETSEEIDEYLDEAVSKAKYDINNAVLEASNEIANKLQITLTNIDKREDFAIGNMNTKYNEAIDLIESAEFSAIEDIRLEVEFLKNELKLEVEGLEGLINNELEKALKEIQMLQDKALSEISKMEAVVKNTITNELEGAKNAINDEVEVVKQKMNEYMLELKTQLNQHKDHLMGEIVADKDDILLEFEREANRLIEMIREQEFKLFQDLNETQQAIINRIQLVVANYDVEMELIKNAKILELEIVVQGYDIMIENSKAAAANEIEELGDSYLLDLTNTKNDCVVALTGFKDQFVANLNDQYSTHSLNLNDQYSTHSLNLNDQALKSNSDLEQNYNTHSSELLKEKNEYSQNLVDIKTSSMSEISNLKNTVIGDIGKDEDSGLWKLIRNSIIKTGEDATNLSKTDINNYSELNKDSIQQFTDSKKNDLESFTDSKKTNLTSQADIEIERIKDVGVDKIVVELEKKQNKVDNSLCTLSKEIVGAINEIKLEIGGGGEESLSSQVSKNKNDISNLSIEKADKNLLDSAIVQISTNKNDISNLSIEKADKTTQIIAGKGLIGGGDLSSNRTFDIASYDEGIIVNDDNIKLNIVDDLITGGVKRPLSAEQGKVLKRLIDTIGTGGLTKLMKQAEVLSTYDYLGTLPQGGTAITTGMQLYNPKLYLNGIRIEHDKFSVQLNTGLITLNEVYSEDYDVIWLVEDEMPHHISFCFPTMNLLIANTELKNKIELGNVIKILGESDADDGGHYLVKCENVDKIDAVYIGNGRFLNEVPNTKINEKLDRGSFTGTADGLSKIVNDWKISQKKIGNPDYKTDLNDIIEHGHYNSNFIGNLFDNLPVGISGSFTLKVSGIKESKNDIYLTQELVDIYGQSFTRTKVSNVWRSWVVSFNNENSPISKSVNGYCKLANGMIMQWGCVSGGFYVDGQEIRYPVAFSTTSPSVAVSGWPALNQTVSSPGIINEFSDRFKIITPVGWNNNWGFSWIAMGY
ncbi:MAG: gp53-like domain-containing protein [Fusobacteriaceae bacterium]